MKEVELKLTGSQYLGQTEIRIDDKPVKFKKNEFGSYICKVQTESDKVNIKILRLLDVGGVLWFITQLFFFLISIFGILDVHHRERGMVIDFETDVYLKEENKITLQINIPQENAKAIDVQTDLIDKEASNKWILDTKAKKTLKGLLFAKIFLALAIIITTIVVLIIKL